MDKKYITKGFYGIIDGFLKNAGCFALNLIKKIL